MHPTRCYSSLIEYLCNKHYQISPVGAQLRLPHILQLPTSSVCIAWRLTVWQTQHQKFIVMSAALSPVFSPPPGRKVDPTAVRRSWGTPDAFTGRSARHAAEKRDPVWPFGALRIVG